MRIWKNSKISFIIIFTANIVFFPTPGLPQAEEQASGEVCAQMGHSGDIYSLSLSPDGRYIVSGSSDHTAKLWNIETSREIRTFKGFSNSVDKVAFHPNGRIIAAGSYSKVKLWDLYTGRELLSIQGSSPVVYSPSGRYLLTAYGGTTLKLWTVDNGRLGVRSFQGRHDKHIFCAAFSADGRYVVTGSSDRTIKLWDVSSGKEIRTFTGHTKLIFTAVFSPDGRYILSGAIMSRPNCGT
jgi:WD40 repeat protein